MSIEFPNGKYKVKLGHIPAGNYEIPGQEKEMVIRLETLLEFVAEIADENERPIPVQIECVESWD